jgi:hypothetical protein
MLSAAFERGATDRPRMLAKQNAEQSKLDARTNTDAAHLGSSLFRRMKSKTRVRQPRVALALPSEYPCA